MPGKFVGHHNVYLEKITVPERLRSVSADHVATIVESVKQCGEILNPIIVGAEKLEENPDQVSFFLIAGAHRFEAAKQAGLERIPSQVWEDITPEEARLIEIDENLIRHELNPLDRAVFLSERKDVYEKMHPETKNGAQGSRSGQTNENDTMSFSNDTAERTGLGKRTIERAVKIAKGIPVELRKRIIGTELAQNQKELLELAKIGDQMLQAQIVERIVSGQSSKVGAAVKEIKGHVEIEKNKDDTEFEKLVELFQRASKAAQDRFLDVLEDNHLIIRPETKAAK